VQFSRCGQARVGLDEDEFDQLSLDADTHDQALAGLDILLDMVHNQQLAQVFKA